MPKAYWIAHLDVHDADTYAAYANANPDIFKKFGGRFLVRGGRHEVAEGKTASRHVIIEFPDYATALACFRSPEYQANMQIRLKSARTDGLIIIEGYDGPQPESSIEGVPPPA